MSKTSGEIFEKTNFSKLPEMQKATFWPRDILDFASKFSFFWIFAIFKSLTLRIFDFFKSQTLNPKIAIFPNCHFSQMFANNPLRFQISLPKFNFSLNFPSKILLGPQVSLDEEKTKPRHTEKGHTLAGGAEGGAGQKGW